MRTTDEITFTFRQFNDDDLGNAVIAAINHAMQYSVGLPNPKVIDVNYNSWDENDWFGPSDERPTPQIKVTVAGSE